MKIIYLICNNLLTNNITYDLDLDIEKKKEVRPLSSDGVKASIKLSIGEVEHIFSSTYASCIETAKYIAEKKDLDIFVINNLNDCKVGDLKNQSIKTLAYFQEKNLDYKQDGGESINECAFRINSVIEKIKQYDGDSVVFLPRRALFSYLTKYTEHGLNLDDRLVLLKDDEVIMESTSDDLEIFKLIIDGNKTDIVKF